MATPVFLLCENEQTDLDGVYVLHTRAPRFLAARINDSKQLDFSVVDDMDNMFAFFENDDKKVSSLMNKLKDWYTKYQKYLDDQYRFED